MTKYKIHPYAEIFPPFSEAEYESLVRDIGEHGLREPILLFEGKVLDGVHRLRACTELHIEPRVRNYTGKNPLAVAISENLKRRHLNESQRGLVAAKLVTMKNGGNRRSDQTANLPSEKSNSQAAQDLNVSERTVRTAKEILKTAPKKEIQAVEKGEKTVTAVARQIKQTKAATDTLKDRFDRTVPDEMVSEWKRAEQVGRKLVSLAREIKSLVSEGFAGAKQDRVKDVIFAEISNSSISDAESLAWSLSSVVPYALCPTCQGVNRKTCGLCKKRGWISKFLWNSPAVSDATKKLISGK